MILFHVFLMRVRNISRVSVVLGQEFGPALAEAGEQRWPVLEGKWRPGGCLLDVRVLQSLCIKGACAHKVRWGLFLPRRF